MLTWKGHAPRRLAPTRRFIFAAQNIFDIFLQRTFNNCDHGAGITYLPRPKRVFYGDRFPTDTCVRRNPFEAVIAATASSTKGLQAITTEMTDYSKKSFERSRAHFEKLIGVKNINEAMQLQSDFAKSAYEDFVAEPPRSAAFVPIGRRRPSRRRKIGRGPSS